MGGLIEKKWFVYIGDHHEGPFSVEEIQQKISLGQASKENYVWAEGMPDWKAMPEVPEFSSLFNPYPAQPEPIPETISEATIQPVALEETKAISSHELQAVTTPPVEEPRTQEAHLNLNPSPSPEASSSQNAPSPKLKEHFQKNFSRLLKIFLLCLGLGSGTAFYFMGFFNLPLEPLTQSIQLISQSATEKFPALSRWISPLPQLKFVSPEEYEELKIAVKENLTEVGPKFAIALSQSDALSPTFYIASNLPDGARFRIYIVGIADTLMNQLSFDHHSEVVLKNHLANTEIIRSLDNKPVPRGEYLLYLAASETQPNEILPFMSKARELSIKTSATFPKSTKLLAFKTYFLGGPRDAIYTSRLKEYHEKLLSRSRLELDEIKQFTMTLESQHTSTLTKFNLLKKGRTNLKQKKQWMAFHEQWIKLNDQLTQIFQKWSPTVLKNESFYPTLYTLTQQTGQAIEKLHTFQNAFFTQTTNLKTFETQLVEAVSSAQSMLDLLKTKTNQAETLPLTPNGMPRRDGL